MKKIFFAIPMIAVLTSCGIENKFEANIDGYASQCIHGVLYYQFPSGATVAYNKDGSIRLCDE